MTPLKARDALSYDASDSCVAVVWKIKGFSCIGEDSSERSSPEFYFSNATWILQLRWNPNSFGKIGLYLKQTSIFESTFRFQFYLKNDHGKIFKSFEDEELFSQSNTSCGHEDFLDERFLVSQNIEKLLSQDILTIHCEISTLNDSISEINSNDSKKAKHELKKASRTETELSDSMIDRPSKRHRSSHVFQCCPTNEDSKLLQSPKKSQFSHVELIDERDLDMLSFKKHSYRSSLNSTFKSDKSGDHCGETSFKVKMENDNLLELVLRELSKIRRTQERMEQKLDLFLKSDTSGTISAVGMNFDSELNFSNFPLNSVEDLQLLDDALFKQENKKYLLHRFMLCGGLNYGDHTRRIMKFLLTDSLGEKYSWLGTKGKLQFVNLRISSVIIAAVVEAFKGTITEALVEDSIKAWLRHCKERRVAVEKKSGVYSYSKQTGENGEET